MRSNQNCCWSLYWCKTLTCWAACGVGSKRFIYWFSSWWEVGGSEWITFLQYKQNSSWSRFCSFCCFMKLLVCFKWSQQLLAAFGVSQVLYESGLCLLVLIQLNTERPFQTAQGCFSYEVRPETLCWNGHLICWCRNATGGRVWAQDHLPSLSSQGPFVQGGRR